MEKPTKTAAASLAHHSDPEFHRDRLRFLSFPSAATSTRSSGATNFLQPAFSLPADLMDECEQICTPFSFHPSLSGGSGNRIASAGMVFGMPCIQLGDGFPRDVSYRLAAGDCSRQINLDRVGAGDMVHYDADGTTVRNRCRGTPSPLRDSFHEGNQASSASSMRPANRSARRPTELPIF
jgi:hypothetical protein